MQLCEWLGLMWALDIGVCATVAGARRFVITTLAYHTARALWAAGGCTRRSSATDAWVRAAPVAFRELEEERATELVD